MPPDESPASAAELDEELHTIADMIYDLQDSCERIERRLDGIEQHMFTPSAQSIFDRPAMFADPDVELQEDAARQRDEVEESDVCSGFEARPLTGSAGEAPHDSGEFS